MSSTSGSAQGSTSSNTQDNKSGVTPREFDIYVWEDLLHFAEHLEYVLEESGCLEKEEREYYEGLRQALLCIYHEYFMKGNEEQEKVFKAAVVEAIRTYVGRLEGCI